MILPGWCGLKSSHQPPGPGVELTAQVHPNKSESGGADILTSCQMATAIENMPPDEKGELLDRAISTNQEQLYSTNDAC